MARGECFTVSVLCALAVLAVVSSQSSPYVPPDPDTYHLEQPADHFDSSNPSTFEERILVYDKYYTEDSGNVDGGNGLVPVKPMFFCPGGEADVHGGYEHNGFMFEFGIEVSAFLLFPEHRFFGASFPFGPIDSFDPDNIKLLTVEQALQDYIATIQWAIKQWNLPSDIPIIAFGGSYPGELASYLRIAFPNVVNGALASSAPVRYHPEMPDGTKNGAFYAVITSDFKRTNATCPDLVRGAISMLADKFSSSSGRDFIQQEMMLCDPVEEGDQNLRLINLWIENAFATLGMENYPYPLDGFPAFPMDAACGVMSTSPASSPLNSLAQTVGVAYNVSGDLKCFNISEEFYPCADITGCGGGVDDPDARSWDYLSCTEVISNVDTNNVTDMFAPAPYSFDNLVAYCENMWDATPDPLHIPSTYNYTQATRVIYSNGLLDPWWPGGVLKEFNGIRTFQIQLAAHHLDLRGSDNSDPQSVRDVRSQERQVILDWLNSPE